MANTNPVTTHLNKNYSPWQHSDTKTIRVPVALADAILVYARQLDSGGGDNQSAIPDDAIVHILAKVNQKLPGYRANSASQLIKDLKTLK